MSKITEEIQKLYPSGLNEKVRICINSASAPARTLAIGLFELGATVIMSDPQIAHVNALSKVLFERSGSKFRYKPVAFESAHKEQAEIFVQLNQLPEGAVPNAKYRINPGSAPKAAEGKPIG